MCSLFKPLTLITLTECITTNKRLQECNVVNCGINYCNCSQGLSVLTYNVVPTKNS